MSITLSSKYQVVIPKKVRDTMNLSSGDTLVIADVTANNVTLKKAPTAHSLIGVAKKLESDPVKRTRSIREEWR